MKWQALIVLLAIALGVVMPPSLPYLSDHGATASIGTLDVCHAAIPALSSSGHMPCMSECPCRILPLVQSAAVEILIPPFKPALFVFQDEHPPKA